MNELLKEIFDCIEMGKVDKNSPFPPSMKGKDGADELTKKALENGIQADDILNKALIPAMEVVGEKFSQKKIFIPQMLISAKAMNKAITHLRPYFISGDIKKKGVFILATVKGDLHDIGKNLVKMTFEGAGWEVIDLGVDVDTKTVLDAINQHQDAKIGLSALLTTTMQSMKDTVIDIKSAYPNNLVLVGGAPVNEKFCSEIGADFYAPDPQKAIAYLNAL